jgi:hypothetical protein
MKSVVAAAAFAVMAACQPAPRSEPPEPAAAPAVAGLRVESAVARPPPGGQTTGAAFLVIRNDADAPDRLIAAASPAAASIELHTHRDDNGVMRMERVDGIDIPARSAVVFEPRGLHLMLFGFAPQGADVPVTLTFERAGAVTTTFAIEAPSAGAGTGKAAHGGH